MVQVGGYRNKWEYFVAGEPIEQMSDATEEATHGQLVLSTQAYKLLEADGETQRNYKFSGELLESTQYAHAHTPLRVVASRSLAGGVPRG